LLNRLWKQMLKTVWSVSCLSLLQLVIGWTLK
jgi:hypothetical protein